MEELSTDSVAPLAGVRVVEIGNYIAGPFCGMQLADLGADVIKIEAPDGGDIVRTTGPFKNGQSGTFARINRHKRSLAMDLKDPRGKALFQRLAERADVVIENLRPGAMARLGLEYDALKTLNPRLIYLAASGWGQDGPLAQLPGLDIMVQARSGLMSITGEPDGDPVKVGVPICDLVCALYGALAVMAALAARQRTGQGQLIDVSLLESTMSLAVWEAGRYFTTGEVPARLGSAHQTSAPYQAIRARDGWFTVGATTPRNWHGFCRALGLTRLENDPRYADVNLRFAHRRELIDDVEKMTVTQPPAHWIGRLEREGVPCAPIQDFGQSFNDPQLLARHYFWDAPHPVMGPVRQLGSPMRFASTKVRRGRAAPLLGEDTQAILHEVGCSDAEIEDLLKAGVAAEPQSATSA
ncbi:MAG TPA: CoA transferase [Candidatus Acidoferrum sp.]|nr:CoA transferase [Candidatus Acidoferrum sp.]